MNNATTMLSGSCLCGAVTYSLTEHPSEFYFCHCRQCQKVSGSSFAANIIAPVDSIAWRSGDHLLIHFNHPERAFSKTFCSLCGSGLPHINKTQTRLVVPAGSLDQAPALQPRANLFTGESPEWLSTGLSAANFYTYPELPESK
jgi:hypothetical protein